MYDSAAKRQGNHYKRLSGLSAECSDQILVLTVDSLRWRVGEYVVPWGPRTSPDDPFRFFLKVNSPRFVGELTPKVNSRPESETIIDYF